MPYLCPLCQSNLEQHASQFRCKNNHSFDKAKEGYVNLLPVQNKKSKDPGDNKDMVLARRAFLEQGHYQFLQQAIAEKAQSLAATGNIVDLGCGEGFYTHKLADGEEPRVFGLDISKPAVRYAAKRYKNCEFSVASISNTPFSAGFADLMVSVFAPLFEQELFRLCKPGGYLLVASPASFHLQQLKQIIYSDVRAHQPVKAPQGFKLIEQEELTQTIDLSLVDAKNLVMMTPFAWKFRPEHWQQLEEMESIEVTFSFYLACFQKDVGLE